MASNSDPTAATITVREVLELLDGDFRGLAAGVGDASYAVWLGSGISRDRLDDLKAIVERVLSYLREGIVPGAADCAYSRALTEAIALARLSPAEESGVDFSVPVSSWPCLPTILSNLALEYARLLDIRVDGRPDADHLLWDVVDVPATFAPARAEPDAEHVCLAVLMAEGVLPDIASANWDGLIEAAVEEVSAGSPTVLRVCVKPDDLREHSLQARLLKFHGCAVRAGLNPTAYRPLLIARQSQITAWPDNPDYALMKAQLVNLAATRPTLMIGLSAQDSNIQSVFSAARSQMAWTWPSDPPAYVFAEDSLGNDQINILRVVYGEAYDSNSRAIEESALLRAFAKPALTALVLHVISSKLAEYARNVDAPGLPGAERETVVDGIRDLRDRLGAGADGDRLHYVRAIVQAATRAMTLFQEGQNPSPGITSYRPLGSLPMHMIASDPSRTTNGVRELAAAIGLLGMGAAAGTWSVANGDVTLPNAGTLELDSGRRLTRIYFAANAQVGVQLEANGIVRASSDDAVVLHSTKPALRSARSPRGAPGRTGKAGLRVVDMAELLRDATSASHLSTRLREEMGV
jgi:hypothetical protein